MIYLALTLLILTLAAGWAMTLFTLPGNWVMLAALALFAAFGPHADAWGISTVVVGMAAGLAVLGEIFELVAGALGAKARGQQTRSLLAVVGSLAGAMIGIGLGTPVGPIGWVLGGARRQQRSPCRGHAR